jgi:transposase-like protein
MQVREGSFHGPRPACPEHPKQRVHRHGFYARFENCDSQQRLRIERFVCPRCGRTLSVLPKNRLPYLALNTTMVESEFDARASGTDPPSRSEKERGCLRRAFARFAARVTSLCALLGQMIGPIKPSVGECWSGLRQLDNLEGILLWLGTKFNTSLLADYRCLQPGF